jgi:hypothetical protein
MKDSLTNSSIRSRGRLRTGHGWLLAAFVSVVLMGCKSDSKPGTNSEQATQEKHEVMKQPDLVHRKGFLVMGTVTSIKPGTEHPETFASIWKDFETHRERIERQSTDPRYYGEIGRAHV